MTDLEKPPQWAADEAREMLLKVRGVDAFTAVELAAQILARVRGQALEQAADLFDPDGSMPEDQTYKTEAGEVAITNRVGAIISETIRALKEKDPEVVE